ncbi:MAG: hypothetical protein CMP23_01115 [Rickettsiales bacterium]|nr:hypothetical protein [Rickettsiales bacterium]|tara:strand:+ start:817 stop:1692 length:876 start_codon:yes stop_codon:yes gene_type:complete
MSTREVVPYSPSSVEDEVTRKVGDMAAKTMLTDGYHMSLSISSQLWSDLLGEALPIQVGNGDFDLIEHSRRLLHAAEDQVKGLLEGATGGLEEPALLRNPRVRGVASGLRRIARRGRRGTSRRLRETVKVQGRWRARVSRQGSRFSYHDGGVTLDARAVLELEGRALLFGEQFEIPFTISRHLDGTASVNEVAYNRNVKRLEGRLGDVSLSLGDSLPLRLLKVLGDRLLEQQVARLNPLPLIPGSSLEQMVSPGQGPLRFSAGIDDLHLGINENDLTLSIRFAFKGDGVAA